MARATLGPLLNTLSGKLGNGVVTNSKGLFSVRAMPKSVRNPQSHEQSHSRAALAVFVEAWRGLTVNQRRFWVHLAAQMRRGQASDASVSRGDLITVPRGPFSAYSAFITCNMNRYMYRYSDLDDVIVIAPLIRPLIEPLLTFTVGFAGVTITATWTYITPGPLDQRLGIWLKSAEAGIHPQLIYTEARNANGNVPLTSARGANGNSIDFPNGVYYLQAIIVDQYGFTTAPSQLVPVKVDI